MYWRRTLKRCSCVKHGAGRAGSASCSDICFKLPCQSSSRVPEKLLKWKVPVGFGDLEQHSQGDGDGGSPQALPELACAFLLLLIEFWGCFLTASASAVIGFLSSDQTVWTKGLLNRRYLHKAARKELP